MVNEGAPDVVLVTQFPTDSWFEGFAVRPNNHLLAARLDEPGVWDVDPEDPDSEPQAAFEFPGEAAAMNLAPVPGRDDEYSVITSKVSDLAMCRWRGFSVWSLKFDSNGKPTGKKMGDVRDIILPLGVCPVTERCILVADSAQHCISCLDVTTGESTVLLAHEESMGPKGEGAFFGINRMCLVGGYVWWSNFSAGSIHRASCQLDDSNPRLPLRITGPVELITDELEDCDGFQVVPDGTAAYTLNFADGSLIKTDLKSPLRGNAKTTTVQDRLVNPTCVELSRPGSGKQKLFVICCGEIEVGWSDTSLAGKEWADVTKTVEITITSE